MTEMIDAEPALAERILERNAARGAEPPNWHGPSAPRSVSGNRSC